MAIVGDRKLQASVDLYLKTVRAAAQAEVAQAVRDAITQGKLSGYGSVDAAVALTCEKIGLNVTIYSKIKL